MMDSLEAQKVISRHRKSEIVITTFTTTREWHHVSANPDLDLPLTGAMGKASSLGLGLALAQPTRKVIVLDGDGSLLMNLGSLLTIANMSPPNLFHFVFENNVYRTTGGQPIPNAGNFSFTRLAKEAGYANLHEFEDLKSLESSIDTVLDETGPTFVSLKITPATERPPFPSNSMASVISRFMTVVQRPSKE